MGIQTVVGRRVNMRAGSGMRCPEGLIRAFCVAAVPRHWRPAGTHRQLGRCKFRESVARVNHLAADDRQVRFESLDVFLGNRKVVRGENGQVRQLSGNQRALLSVQPCASPILMGQSGCRTTDRWCSITRPVAAPEQRRETVEFMEEVRACQQAGNCQGANNNRSWPGSLHAIPEDV